MKNGTRAKERTFSVELGSRGGLRSMNVSAGAEGGVLVEGTIGRLVRASFAEGIILEVVGSAGAVRIDLAPGEIAKDRPAAPPEVTAP